MLRVVKTGFVCAAFAGAASASAGSQGSAGMPISLVVPEVCEIDVPSLVLDTATNTATGSIVEACNSDRGFRIIASHRAIDPGESARIRYDGNQHALDASGISTVAMRHGPVYRRVPLSIETNGLEKQLTISIGIALI